MLAHIFCQQAKTDAGEVVDREPGVAWVVHREESFETRPENLISHAFMQFRQAQVLSEILEENLDEDTTARSCLLFVQVDDGQHVPADGIVADHMAEEAGNVA